MYIDIIQFIEDNKTKYGIDYESSIESLKEMLEEIEEQYKTIKD